MIILFVTVVKHYKNIQISFLQAMKIPHIDTTVFKTRGDSIFLDWSNRYFRNIHVGVK